MIIYTVDRTGTPSPPQKKKSHTHTIENQKTPIYSCGKEVNETPNTLAERIFNLIIQYHDPPFQMRGRKDEREIE